MEQGGWEFKLIKVKNVKVIVLPAIVVYSLHTG